jgi:hypothetical protein
VLAGQPHLVAVRIPDYRTQSAGRERCRLYLRPAGNLGVVGLVRVEERLDWELDDAHGQVAYPVRDPWRNIGRISDEHAYGEFVGELTVQFAKANAYTGHAGKCDQIGRDGFHIVDRLLGNVHSTLPERRIPAPACKPQGFGVVA